MPSLFFHVGTIALDICALIWLKQTPIVIGRSINLKQPSMGLSVHGFVILSKTMDIEKMLGP
jgi:hypothetical protein